MAAVWPEGERVPFVSLRPYAYAGKRIDPVHPEVAALIGQQDAQLLGLLPFSLGEREILAAAAWPLHPEAEEFLHFLPEQVRLLRAAQSDLSAATCRAFDHTHRFGEWAVALGRATPRQVLFALAQQQRSGGLLGEILVGAGALTGGDVAQILARQGGLPFVDLLSADADSEAFALMPEEFWRQQRIVPFAQSERAVYVASDDPHGLSRDAAAALERSAGRSVRVYASGRRDLREALALRYRAADLAKSRDGLREARPEDSAIRLLSRGQKVFAAIGLLALAGGLWRSANTTLLVLNIALQAAYLGLLGFKLWLFRKPAEAVLEREVTGEELAALDERELPVYTVLVPLRDEASVLPTLAKALAALDYPKDRLDIKLLLEENDSRTLRAARTLGLPSYVEILVLPDALPRTKPKACNYGLLHARGEYVVIYDAEDIPARDQLKKAVIAFRSAAPDVACVQAKLSYYNRTQNALTRWFTSEYAMWFDLLLPGLQNARMPIPLGGTSNHLRVAPLRDVGAWDPYNVTEDADLGIRLHKAGYRTLMVNSDTYEEANADFVNWVRQRSRWVKGYIQTWIVHMRHPVRLWRELGTKGFLGFQAMILGTPLTFVLNPVLWALTTAWFLTAAGIIQAIFPTWVYYAGMLSLLSGNFVFSYLNMVAVARRGEWDLVESAMTAPAYWSLMSIAAWKALIQLALRPSHWEKTVHGLARGAPQSPPTGRGARGVAS